MVGGKSVVNKKFVVYGPEEPARFIQDIGWVRS